jgi:zinc/manganese transport system substrate-binding protein
MKYLIFLLVFSTTAFAKLKVVTTTPDLAWLVREIGGQKVMVESLLDGHEDPHYVDAMPHFILKVSKADMFCLVGLDLEIGWVPKVLSKSGNAKVQSGGKGYCETGKTVKAVEVPQGKIDRSMGDIHPSGNPHYHLGPNSYLEGGNTVLNTLIELDASNTAFYVENFSKLEKKIKDIKKKVKKVIGPLEGKKLIQYHKEFSYFFKDYGIDVVGEIEEVPGVPPSAGRLAKVSISAKRNKVNLAIATETNPKKILGKFEEISGVPVLIVPHSLKKEGFPKDYEELQINMAKAIMEKLK